jgi:hypothetical protein
MTSPEEDDRDLARMTGPRFSKKQLLLAVLAGALAAALLAAGSYLADARAARESPAQR